MRTQALAMILAVGLLAAGAGADFVIWSGDIYDAVITNPVPVGANPAGEQLYGFIFKIVNTTGDPGYDPAGFNGCTPQETSPDNPGAWPGLPSFFGIKGNFHNQYLVMDGTSPTLDDPDFATDIDTHFNLLAGDILFVGTPPSETNLQPGTAEPFNATGPWAAFAANDFGDRLYGNFAINGGATGPVWELAYLVTPNPTPPNLLIGNPGFWFEFYMTGIKGGEVVSAVPEPATMSLLAIGAAALLRRRSR